MDDVVVLRLDLDGTSGWCGRRHARSRRVRRCRACRSVPPVPSQKLRRRRRSPAASSVEGARAEARPRSARMGRRLEPHVTVRCAIRSTRLGVAAAPRSKASPRQAQDLACRACHHGRHPRSPGHAGPFRRRSRPPSRRAGRRQSILGVVHADPRQPDNSTYRSPTARRPSNSDRAAGQGTATRGRSASAASVPLSRPSRSAGRTAAPAGLPRSACLPVCPAPRWGGSGRSGGAEAEERTDPAG